MSYFTTNEGPDFELNQAFILEQEFRLDISPWPVAVEEEITLLLTPLLTDDTIEAVSARVEGVNMNMGRIPVIWWKQPKTGDYKGHFMLGSCSEPKMQWRLVVDVQLQSGKKIQRLAEFSSYTDLTSH